MTCEHRRREQPPESGAEAASGRLRAADRAIAVIGAVAYVRSQWPPAERVWGDTRQPPVRRPRP